MKKISYQTFFWSIGTTSFRMKQFNRMVEEQLRLLNEFWKHKENKDLEWNSKTQIKYYNFMKLHGFITGDEKKKDKNAREKTSGLVDLGLIYSDRRLTPVGQQLLYISAKGDFSTDNTLLIEKDSFVYLKQLLKTSYKLGNGYVRPFIVVLYILTKVGHISYDEFRYLLPLCIDNNSTITMIKKIQDIRIGKIDIDSIIIDKFMSMENYKQALDYFIEQNKITEKIIIQIGMNRKSKSYDKQYYRIYTLLKKIYIEKQYNKINELYNNLKTLRLSKYWVRNFFGNGLKKKVTMDDLVQNDFSNIKNEKTLKKVFFKFMHLNKIKATLDDYFDLNKRYIGLADVINFQNNTITLSIISKIFFTPIIDDIYKSICYTESYNLTDNIDLKNIDSCLDLNESKLISNYNILHKKTIKSIKDIKKDYYNDKYNRFNSMIDEMFNKNKLKELLECFKQRNDKKINQDVTQNADIPTIFEYIVGIIWYEISDRKGDILSYMNLSLDANLLPKSHATGGIADIIYKYEQAQKYPQHALLIEATLTDRNIQRRSEMEPVSRHLGEYLLKNSNHSAYCVFITTNLDINVISDFRSRKFIQFYDTKDSSNVINGMKIIPLETDILKLIIEKDYRYDELYCIFDQVYNNELNGLEWYNKVKEQFI